MINSRICVCRVYCECTTGEPFCLRWRKTSTLVSFLLQVYLTYMGPLCMFRFPKCTITIIYNVHSLPLLPVNIMKYRCSASVYSILNKVFVFLH